MVFFAALSCCNQEMEHIYGMGNAWLCRGMGEGKKERKKPNYPPHSDAITKTTHDDIRDRPDTGKRKKNRTVS